MSCTICAWLRRGAEALYAWVCQRMAAFTDWVVDGALARLGERMEWRDVERIAQARIKREQKPMAEWLREFDEMMESGNRARLEVGAAAARALTEKVDKEIMAMGPPRPELRLVKKP